MNEKLEILTVTDRYVIHNNGTVTDTETGLMWKRCSEGQSGEDWSPHPARYTWNEAMRKFRERVGFAGYNDWRMPTIDELKTLVDKNYMPSINQVVFPNTAMFYYWSSTENSDFLPQYIYFGNGSNGRCGRGYDGVVRLVRSGL